MVLSASPTRSTPQPPPDASSSTSWRLWHMERELMIESWSGRTRRLLARVHNRFELFVPFGQRCRAGIVKVLVNKGPCVTADSSGRSIWSTVGKLSGWRTPQPDKGNRMHLLPVTTESPGKRSTSTSATPSWREALPRRYSRHATEGAATGLRKVHYRPGGALAAEPVQTLGGNEME
jgi:hypothetical protein